MIKNNAPMIKNVAHIQILVFLVLNVPIPLVLNIVIAMEIIQSAVEASAKLNLVNVRRMINVHKT